MKQTNSLLRWMGYYLRLVQVLVLVCGLISLTQNVLAQNQVAVVNAASYDGKKILAPDTIAAAFGNFPTQGNQTYVGSFIPGTTMLPTTLGGVTVRVNGVDAQLFFVSPTQINLAVPGTLADNASSTIMVISLATSPTTVLTGSCIVARSSPGIFTSNANGQGVPAALTTFDGTSYERISQVVNNSYVATDIDPGTAARPNILVLYGTGIRNTPAANPNDANRVAEAVTVRLQGVPLQVTYAGAAPSFVGLDQINAILPPQAAGFSLSNLTLTAGTYSSPVGAVPFDANTTQIKIGGIIPDVNPAPITIGGAAIAGTLGANDQIRRLTDGTGRTYFYDAYKFTTTAASTLIAVAMTREELNGNSLDSALFLYDMNGNTPVKTSDPVTGFDDQTGSFGNGQVATTNNALLLKVVPAGNYVVLARSADSQPDGRGNYTIKFSSPPALPFSKPPASPFSPITITPWSWDVAISAGDILTSANTYLKVFYFNAAAGDVAQIDMTSSAFPSTVFLQQNGFPAPNGNSATAGAIGATATLTKPLNPGGTYLVLATPYQSNVTGNFLISVKKL